MFSLVFEVVIVFNIFDDYLDCYGIFEVYIDVKYCIFDNVKFVVVWWDGEFVVFYE